MNKKEIAEIRRRFNTEKNNVTVIRGCYVNDNREIVSSFTVSPIMTPEEELEKYFSVFKRALSGTEGGNLINVEFSTSQVESGEEHKLLTALRDSALTDDEPVNALCKKIIDANDIEGNYLILLAHDAYDMPSRSRDGSSLEDSMQVFHYIMCAVCPVKMTKSTLSYFVAQNEFHNRANDWVVSAPEYGFMYPAFDDRATNIYGALYYNKDKKQSHDAVTDAIFHSELPMPAGEQKEAFDAILSDALAEDCSFELIQAVHGQLCELIENHDADKDAREPLTVTKTDVKAMLEACGAADEHVAAFAEKFDEEFGANTELSPVNIVNTKQIEVNASEVSVKLSPENSDRIETRVIDGVKYILIRADEEVELNGVNVNISDMKYKS